MIHDLLRDGGRELFLFKAPRRGREEKSDGGGTGGEERAEPGRGAESGGRLVFCSDVQESEAKIKAESAAIQLRCRPENSGRSFWRRSQLRCFI